LFDSSDDCLDCLFQLLEVAALEDLVAVLSVNAHDAVLLVPLLLRLRIEPKDPADVVPDLLQKFAVVRIAVIPGIPQDDHRALRGNGGKVFIHKHGKDPAVVGKTGKGEISVGESLINRLFDSVPQEVVGNLIDGIYKLGRNALLETYSE
jgi:hypothetical protein